ncbi:MAG: hemerythrin domain-containing protein, partial [Rectinema sp.]
MKATGQLKEEHKGVLAMLGSFETILDRMVGGGAPDRAELASILDFLRVFVDKCHHGKEEELLFPA